MISLYAQAMINFSYNLSPILKNNLGSIELLRQKILLTPLSPKTELHLRFEATASRIYWALIFSKQKSINKSKVTKLIINRQEKEKLKKEEEEVAAAKEAAKVGGTETEKTATEKSPTAAKTEEKKEEKKK